MVHTTLTVCVPPQVEPMFSMGWRWGLVHTRLCLCVPPTLTATPRSWLSGRTCRVGSDGSNPRCKRVVIREGRCRIYFQHCQLPTLQLKHINRPSSVTECSAGRLCNLPQLWWGLKLSIINVPPISPATHLGWHARPPRTNIHLPPSSDRSSTPHMLPVLRNRWHRLDPEIRA
jgi:hypothetical protein